MKHARSVTQGACLLFLFFLSAFLQAGAADSVSPLDSKSSSSPQLSVTAYGLRRLLHDKHEPLLLQVTLSNPLAIRIQMKNLYAARLQRALRRAGETANISPQARQDLQDCSKLEVVPEIVLGSDQQALGDLISFSITDSKKQPSSITVRPLNGMNGAKGPVKLGGQGDMTLVYGIDPPALSKLAEGTYEITARLDSSKQPGRSASTASDTVSINLKDKLTGLTDRAKNNWLYQYGVFYLSDRQYDQVKQCVQHLLASNPHSISAAQLQGDMLLSQGKPDEAVQSYRVALDRCNEKFGPAAGAKLSASEIFGAPQYLYSQLEKAIRRAQSKEHQVSTVPTSQVVNWDETKN